MKSIKVPSLFKATSAQALFKELVETNKESRAFSQRGLSLRLKWPSSYIPDVIKGRKKFTIIRAVQFARYFKLDPIDMEKLILLAVSDIGFMNAEETLQLRKVKSSQRSAPTADQELLDAHVMLVFECVRWFKGQASVADVCTLVARQGLDKAEVLRCLKMLVHKKLVLFKDKKYATKDINLASDDFMFDDGKVHSQFVEFLGRFMQERVGPASYNSSLIHIERARFEEIADKIVAFRNWLHEISLKDETLPAANDVRLFQLDLNLTPVFSKDIAQKMKGRREGRS